MEENHAYMLTEDMNGKIHLPIKNANIVMVTSVKESLKYRKQSITEVVISFANVENCKTPFLTHYIGGKQNVIKLILEVG